MGFDVLAGFECRVCAGRREVRAASPVTEVLAGLGGKDGITVLHVDVRLGFK